MDCVCRIAVENAAYAYDKLYSYLLPAALTGAVKPGCRVTVPFGGGNRARTGLVVELCEVDLTEGYKPLSALLDFAPLVDEEGLLLLRYLKEHTFCTWFDALRLLIPAGVDMVRKTMYSASAEQVKRELSEEEIRLLHRLQRKKTISHEELLREPDARIALDALLAMGLVCQSEQTRQRIREDRIRMVKLTESGGTGTLTPKQAQVIGLLEEMRAVSRGELCECVGVGQGVVDTLARKGWVELFEVASFRSPFSAQPPEREGAPSLSPAQEQAARELMKLADETSPQPALLYGVTGSGKTQVFMALIDHVLQKGKTALILAPEISLTAQVVDTFRRRFGDAVAVLHSALSLGERMDEWKRARTGQARVVVGTRSAVFAPLQNIGLIVIDEEQEHTYHSDRSPRYHAREVALRRAQYHGALLLAASATPSVESFYHARQGHYRLITLEERFGNAILPDVYVVDMRDPENVGQSAAFSEPLLGELRYNLERGEQSILLLNRRGYSTLVKCSSCGTVADCPNCSVAMTYHAAKDSLLCHYCGYSTVKPKACAHCGSELIRYAGVGTQKLEEELSALFPQARLLRVDMDTTMAKFSHERLFAAFSAGEHDIMIGTQMVAKGLNFPNVTLVGVLGTDQALYAGDFRSYERAFSLLTQVVGRCGRGDKRGRAFIQTFSPENPIIYLASQQDYTGFFREEIASRKLHLYPPFCVLAGVGFVGDAVEEVQRWSLAYLEEFCRVAASDFPSLPIRALGPVPSEVLRVAGKYRYKLILKCKSNPDMRALLSYMLEWFYKRCKTVSVYIDMHGG